VERIRETFEFLLPLALKIFSSRLITVVSLSGYHKMRKDIHNSKVKVNVKLKTDLYLRVKILAVTSNKNIYDIVNDALEQYMKKGTNKQ
jgi:hypothetical protein